MGKLTSNTKLAFRMILAGLLTALRIRIIRRKIMFYALAGTMLAVYLGFTLLDGFLVKHPLIFAIYWFYCATLVVFMLILAVYDLAAVKDELNIRAKQELRDTLKDIEETVRAGNRGSEDNEVAKKSK
jgi:hypothetical protein